MGGWDGSLLRTALSHWPRAGYWDKVHTVWASGGKRSFLPLEGGKITLLLFTCTLPLARSWVLGQVFTGGVLVSFQAYPSTVLKRTAGDG